MFGLLRSSDPYNVESQMERIQFLDNTLDLNNDVNGWSYNQDIITLQK